MGNPFLYQGIQVNYINNLFWNQRMILLYKCHSHASSSFLIGCFMNDKPTIVNHELILYSSMPFLLYQNSMISFFFYFFRPWNLLFCGIYKSKKTWKYFSTSSGVLSLFVILYIFCGIGKLFLIKWLYLLNISTYVTLIQIKQKAI